MLPGQLAVFTVDAGRRSLTVVRRGRSGRGWATISAPVVPEKRTVPGVRRRHHHLLGIPRPASIERVQVTVHSASYEQCGGGFAGHEFIAGLLMAAAVAVLTAGCHGECTYRSVQSVKPAHGGLLRPSNTLSIKKAVAHQELEGLKQCRQLEGLNQDFSRRIKDHVSDDALSNAVLMFATSVVVAASLDTQLQHYESFLTNGQPGRED